jgi:ABC-2 type transport system ATP-binding protein
MWALAREIQKRRKSKVPGTPAQPLSKAPPSVKESKASRLGGKTAIEVTHLQKVYGRLTAVDDLSFSAGMGEVFSVLGPNGAGKSTTVEILEGLRARTAGSVRVLGEDPWLNLDRIKSQIGVVPQDFHFFPKLTPREALKLYSRLFEVRIDPDELLARVELSDKADSTYERLSGGQRQKVGLALALVNDPAICFLDEPTSGLDPRARRSVWQVIRSLCHEGRTVFLTTHYLEEAQQLADRIAILNHGRLIASGSPAEIIARYGGPERMRIVGPPDIAERLKELGIAVRENIGNVEVEFTSRAQAAPIFRLMASDGLKWESFTTVTDTLEDVFIRLVGAAEDEGSPGASQGVAA